MVGAFSPVIERSHSPAGNVKRAHVIILGNEKGGSGKTTTCMHLVIALLRLGFSVGTIDTDSRQRSLSRYVENRRQTVAREGVALPLPYHIVVQKSPFNVTEDANADERDRFFKAMARLLPSHDFVIIDSPGNDTYLSRLAHSFSDTIITPINDSFVDLDVLATVDGATLQIVRPSIYSEMIWEQKLERAKRDGGAIEWVVMRNRLSNIDAKNKRFMTQATADLARRLGFRVAPGFSERVIFREMFLQGLTVLDVMDANGVSVSMSHIAARQEVRDLLKTLHLAQVDARLEEKRGVITSEPKEAAPEEEDDVADESAATSKLDSALRALAEAKSEVRAEPEPVESAIASPSASGQESISPVVSVSAPAPVHSSPAMPVFSSTPAASSPSVSSSPVFAARPVISASVIPSAPVSASTSTSVPASGQDAVNRLFAPKMQDEPTELAS